MSDVFKITDYKGMPNNILLNKIIHENIILSYSDLMDIFFGIEDSEQRLIQLDWVLEIYGERAWFFLGDEGYYSAILFDMGNNYFIIQSVFPTVGISKDEI